LESENMDPRDFIEPDDDQGHPYGPPVKMPDKVARGWKLRPSIFQSRGRFDDENVIHKFAFNPATGELFLSDRFEKHAATIQRLRESHDTESLFEEFVRGIVFYRSSYEEGEGGRFVRRMEPVLICLRVFSQDKEENFVAQHATEVALRECCGVDTETPFEYDVTNQRLIEISREMGQMRTDW